MQNYASKTEQPEQPQSMLTYCNEKFEKLNHQQSDLINSIEARLHDIINKRHPEPSKENEKGGVSPKVDIATQFNNNLNWLANNNDRLSQLLTHLSEIV